MGSASINQASRLEFKQKYLSKLEKEAKNNSMVIDKMPDNFRDISLICAAFPEAKIVHTRRHPAATIWSNYKHYFTTNGLGHCYDLSDLITYYELYIDLMAFWQLTYNDLIYNLNYDKLIQEFDFEIRSLIGYLGLDWENACLSPHENKRSVRTASQQQVRTKFYQGSSNAWRKYEQYLGGIFDKLL